MLLALLRAKRQSDLPALDLAFVQYLPESVEFKIPGLTKTRVLEKDVIFFPALKVMFSCAQLPVSGNIIRRQKHHHNHSGDSQPFFLATQRPYSPVSSTSIGRWLKLTLQNAGIDISVFKTYSTIASSSAARQSAVSVKDILTAADWSRETTFNHFYYRPRHPVSFGTAGIS